MEMTKIQEIETTMGALCDEYGVEVPGGFREDSQVLVARATMASTAFYAPYGWTINWPIELRDEVWAPTEEQVANLLASGEGEVIE